MMSLVVMMVRLILSDYMVTRDWCKHELRGIQTVIVGHWSCQIEGEIGFIPPEHLPAAISLSELYSSNK